MTNYVDNMGAKPVWTRIVEFGIWLRPQADAVGLVLFVVLIAAALLVAAWRMFLWR